MILDFPNIKEERLPRFKGGEKEYIARMFVDEHNRITAGLNPAHLSACICTIRVAKLFMSCKEAVRC